jgi:hypothetical protein
MKMINKETPAGQPPAPGSNQEGAPQGGLSPQALMGLWKTYGPAVISAVSKGRQQPEAPSANSVAESSRSIDTPQQVFSQPDVTQQMPEPTHY